MKILALDLGSKTGFCFGDTLTGDKAFGTWKLSLPKEVTAWGVSRRTRTRDPRIARLDERLRAFPVVDVVVFEDIQFSSTVYACQLWASLRAVVWLHFPPEIKYECVPVGALKKFATGDGSAKKESMATALQKRQSIASLDDNAIDAIWIWLWAKHTLARA